MVAIWGRSLGLAQLATILLCLFLAGCGGGGGLPGAEVASVGAEAVVGDLTISGAWARSMPAGFNGAVYLEVENRGDAPIGLRVAESGVAKRVEMHETVRDGDMLRMVHQPEGVEVAAGSSLIFEPGGFHIMLFELGEALEAGQHFDLEMVAEPGGPITVEVLVRAK
jgi:copper(I)-binding protein